MASGVYFYPCYRLLGKSQASFSGCKNDFDMSNVISLTRCKNKRLAERAEFSDVEDYEDEESDVEDFFFPKKARKRKIGYSDRKVRSHDCRSRKNLLGSDGRKSLASPGPPQKQKASQITSKNHLQYYCL